MSLQDGVREEVREGRSSALAGSAVILVVRQLVTYGMTAASSMFVVRSLEPEVFGRYAAGMAAFALVLGVTDFGFAQLLARRIATPDELDRGLVRRIVSVHVAWTAAVAVTAAGVAVLWARVSVSGAVLLVMIPAVALSGAGSLRQICYWRHEVRPMARIDLTTGAAQAVCLVLFAWREAPVTVLAGVMCACAVTNTLLVGRLAVAHLGEGPRRAVPTRRAVLAGALPLGFALFVPTAYYHADLIIAQALIEPGALGQYASAVKFLSIFTMLPSVIMALALPHLAFAGRDEGALADLVQQVVTWFGSLLFPVCVFVGAFSPLLVGLVYGDAYRESATLLTVLMAGAAVGLAGNVLGTVLVAEGRARWLMRQNVLALGLNIIGNFLFLPRYGVAASAWLSVATEVLVTGGSLLALRGRLDPRVLMRAIRPGLIASVPLVVLGYAGGDSLAVAAFAVVVVPVLLTLTDGWPPDLLARFRRPEQAA